MSLLRSLLFGLALLLFMVAAFVANVGTWALATFLDSETFAVTTTRIIAAARGPQLACRPPR